MNSPVTFRLTVILDRFLMAKLRGFILLIRGDY